MRNWRERLKALTSSPRGWSADGRTLGTGLAAAMAAQREQATREVETYLRDDESHEDRRVTAGV